MQIEIERGDDTEIAAAAAHAPVQLGILLRARAQDLALPGDDLDGAHVVQRKAEAPRDAAEAAAERETADARVRDGARGGDEAACHRLMVQVAQQAAAGHVRDARTGIDLHAAQERQVDQHAAFAGRFA